MTKIQRVHGFCGLKTEAAHNTQLCHNAAGNPNFIIILSLTSSSDCNNFTPRPHRSFLTFSLLCWLHYFLMTVLFCVFIPVFLFPCFLLKTPQRHTQTHTPISKDCIFFHVHVGVAPHPTPPALNCSGFGFIMVHVNVFVSAYIMCVCVCGGGGLFCFFVPQNTVSDCGNNFFFFLSRVKFGNRANGATGIWEKILIVLHSLWHALT